MEEITKLRLGDVGTVFRIRVVEDDLPVDLQSCTVKQILLKKPDGTYLTKTASFYTNGLDGYIQYTSIDGDIDQTGIWKIQGYVEFTNQGWHTTIDSFLVQTNISED
jgi:hypothetical protein